ncbi:MAG: T9SS type A sorting domain-containing protein [Bacteroidota bacterium]
MKKITIFILLAILTNSVLISQTRISSFSGIPDIDKQTRFDNIIVDDGTIYYINAERGIGEFGRGFSSITVYTLEDENVIELYKKIVPKDNGTLPTLMSHSIQSSIYSKGRIYLVYNFIVISIDLKTGEEVQYNIPYPYVIPTRANGTQIIEEKNGVIYAEVYSSSTDKKIVRIDESTSEASILENEVEGYTFMQFRPGFNYLIAEDLREVIRYDYYADEMKTIYEGDVIQHYNFSRTDFSDDLYIVDQADQLIKIDLNTDTVDIFCNEVEGRVYSFTTQNDVLLVERSTDSGRKIDYYLLPECNTAVSSLPFEPEFEGSVAVYSHLSQDNSEYVHLQVDYFHEYVLKRTGQFTLLDVEVGPGLFNFDTHAKGDLVVRYAYDQFQDGLQLFMLDLKKGDFLMGSEIIDRRPEGNPMKLVYDAESDAYITAGINNTNGVELYLIDNDFKIVDKYSVKEPYELAAVKNIYNDEGVIIHLVKDSVFQVKDKEVVFLVTVENEDIQYKEGKIQWLRKNDDTFQFMEFVLSTGEVEITDIEGEYNSTFDHSLLGEGFLISNNWESYYYDDKEITRLEGISRPRNYGDFILDLELESQTLHIKAFDLRDKSFSEEFVITGLSSFDNLGAVGNKLFLRIIELNGDRKLYTYDIENQQITIFNYNKDINVSFLDVLFSNPDERIIVKNRDPFESRLDLISLESDGIRLEQFYNYNPNFNGIGLSIVEMDNQYVLIDRDKASFVHLLDEDWNAIDLSGILSPGFLRSVYYLKNTNQLLSTSSLEYNRVNIDFLNLDDLILDKNVMLADYTADVRGGHAFCTKDGNLVFALQSDEEGGEFIKFDQELEGVVESYEINKGAWTSSASEFQTIDSVLYFTAAGLPLGRQVYYIDNVLAETKYCEVKTFNVVEEPVEPSRNLYPNPAGNYVQIDFTMKNAMIYQIEGRSYNVGYIDAHQKVDLKDLVSGIYFMSGLDENDQIVTLKFVVE